MFAEDVKYLCCPLTYEPLEIICVTEQDSDGEIIEGELASMPSCNKYIITNGIPRFVKDKEYNKTWDYKWTQIDKGKGLNYKVTDPNDLAYRIHDIFDRNNHGGRAYQYVKGRVVLDLGCGVGQNSWRIVKEYQPLKIISMDLTQGVDVFRKIMLERFPEYKSKILIVQANVFEMPFIGFLARAFFGTVMHPDRDYRFINNYDGWCNSWAETWTEQELFLTLIESNIAIKGISSWRTGIWGLKIKDFYS